MADPEPEQDGGYNSASDEDFNPDEAPPNNEAAESSSEADTNQATRTKRTRNKNTTEADDIDFENSGDEATIRSGRRKKPRTASKHGGVESDDGGEGGLVKTRAQRKAEVKEKKPLTEASKSSVNVDDLWAQMAASEDPKGHTISPRQQDQTKGAGRKEPTEAFSRNENTDRQQLVDHVADQHKDPRGENTVTIKRRYDFAGQTIEEDRIVSASSAEARVCHESRNPQLKNLSPDKKPLRRPVKNKSLFGSTDPANVAASLPSKAPKLNTLEKSKLDWAAHVDKEGISDELNEHSRAKEGYLGRVDFLGRMDAKREESIKRDT